MYNFYLLLFFAFNLHAVLGVGYLSRKKIDEAFRNAVADPSTETSYIDQPIDHDGSIDGTWKMLYMTNMKFFKAGGPIYIMIGGEAAANPNFFTENTIFYDLAQDTNGAMIHTEHRYYGESRPYQDLNADTLRYLSSKQALADVAYLIKNLKASNNDYSNSKVVVLGGSYAGNLAAWMRKLYPDLVDAALASSAPVLAKKDFFEYLEKVNDVINQYGTEQCLDNIRNKFKRYVDLLGSPEGRQQLKQEENIDDDLEPLTSRYSFIVSRVNVYCGKVQYGTPNDVGGLCSTGSYIDMKTVNESLIHFNVVGTDDNTAIAWSYQTCTEFGYLISDTSDRQPFGQYVPLDFFISMCQSFGNDFNEARIDKGVQDTNTLYGGKSPNIDKVVFVNGAMDPWSTLSITDSPDSGNHDFAHCADILPETDSDSESLKSVRTMAKESIKKWLGA